MPEEYFERLKSYCFPNVSEMRITLERPMSDVDIVSLSNVFPNLRSFSPHGICKNSLEHFSYLENLSLTCCRSLSINDFRHLITKLNLKSLTLDLFKKVSPLGYEELLRLSKIEHITLNIKELSWVSSYDVKRPVLFENLKTLTITGAIFESVEMDNLFTNIQFIVPRDVHDLEIANVDDAFLNKYMMSNSYEFLKKVRVITLINVRILDDIFCMGSLYENLRKAYFFCSHTTNPDKVCSIISNSKQLDILSFEECKSPKIIINEAVIKESCKGRKKPMTLNWYPQTKNLDILCSEGYENYIKITSKRYVASNFDTMTIKFK
ncbi:uncharacterized protein LOC101451699 [Ceratitis capitata]|uniref:uncharacterized protein LOC101451699 n=1 Tax=Ceratitis capitata TaxID=7213 RepID=UPI0006188163|nr:uncharacterized protein LOC101451699 [Ceratitis capitata]